MATAFAALGIALVASPILVRIQVRQQVKIIQSVLDRIGAPVSTVHVHISTHPKAFLLGSVSNREVLEKLNTELRAHFDDETAKRMLSNVKVEVAPDARQSTSSAPSFAATHPVYWRLAKDQRDRLIAAVNGIRLGDEKEQVRAKLGKPDDELVLVPKGFFPLKPHGTSIKYQFARYEDGLVNEKWDQYLSLSFDNDGHLRQIFSTVPEMPTRGKMIRRQP
jgi:hypothetical protein